MVGSHGRVGAQALTDEPCELPLRIVTREKCCECIVEFRAKLVALPCLRHLVDELKETSPLSDVLERSWLGEQVADLDDRCVQFCEHFANVCEVVKDLEGAQFGVLNDPGVCKRVPFTRNDVFEMVKA